MTGLAWWRSRRNRKASRWRSASAVRPGGSVSFPASRAMASARDTPIRGFMTTALTRRLISKYARSGPGGGHHRWRRRPARNRRQYDDVTDLRNYQRHLPHATPEGAAGPQFPLVFLGLVEGSHPSATPIVSTRGVGRPLRHFYDAAGCGRSGDPHGATRRRRAIGSPAAADRGW